MGKVKQALEQDMMLNPENYNNPDPTKEEMSSRGQPKITITSGARESVAEVLKFNDVFRQMMNLSVIATYFLLVWSKRSSEYPFKCVFRTFLV